MLQLAFGKAKLHPAEHLHVAAAAWQIAVGLPLAAPDTGMNNKGTH